MFLDARDLQSGTALDCDICIVGGGPAGITLARELSGRGFRLFLLESGGQDYEEEAQELAQGSLSGDDYPDLDAGRLRLLGGASNHWSGNCSPLDPIDFEERSWLPYSGWPFSRQTLEPYYKRAWPYCQLPGYHFDTKYWAERTGAEIFTNASEEIDTGIAEYSPPTNFGESNADFLRTAEDVSVLFHATVLELESNETASRVTRAKIGVLGGAPFTVEARFFVLATGGIENARLLLLSNRVAPRGLGNSHDLVGRFFMDHPVVEGAVFRPSSQFKKTLYDPDKSVNPVLAYLKLAEKSLREEGLLNVRMPFEAVNNYYLSAGVSSYHHLTEALSEGDLPNNFWRHVGNVLSDFDMVMEGVSRKTFNTKLFDHADSFGGYLFDTMVEQTPNPDNRITLSEERDAFGQRRSHLHWQFEQRDKDNLWQVYDIIAREVGRLNAGRLRTQKENERLFGELLGYGHHHMGTTRTAHDPRKGVVDSHLRVHEVTNLFVASSSIFPTCGHVPPTLTIVALAIRLAEHLVFLGGRS